MAKPITYVGLDVHKDTIAVALAEAGLRGEVREHGQIPNTPAALKALTVKLAPARRELRFCYEAGPCGYGIVAADQQQQDPAPSPSARPSSCARWRAARRSRLHGPSPASTRRNSSQSTYGIQRQFTEAGHECAVVAPSLIPRKPGERIKTDRRDAINLAKLHRAGELIAVWVPDQAHEAIRDLVRARQAAVRTLRQARQQLSGFLLRHGPPLPPAGLDAVAPALAGKPQVRPGGTSYCAGRLYRGRRGSDGTARPTRDTYRSRVAGVVSRAGG